MSVESLEPLEALELSEFLESLMPLDFEIDLHEDS